MSNNSTSKEKVWTPEEEKADLVNGLVDALMDSPLVVVQNVVRFYEQYKAAIEKRQKEDNNGGKA